MSTYDDIEKLIDQCAKEEAKGPSNTEAIRDVYRKLAEQDEIDCEFWIEVFHESPDWIIEIVASVKPLTIHDIALIKTVSLFEKLLYEDDVNMDNWETVVEYLEEDAETEADPNDSESEVVEDLRLDARRKIHMILAKVGKI